MKCTDVNCPAYAKCLAEHHGSLCKAIRATYGLSDTATTTNYDLLRAMSVEEMAEFLGSIIHDYCQGTAEIEGAGYVITDWLAWLRQESEKEDP